MSQHLHLYATCELTVADVRKWCHARAFELTEMPSAEDRPIVDAVSREIDRLKRTSHHIEHWSNWCGVMIWGFLVWDAFVCDDVLVELAVQAARDTMDTHAGLRMRYPGRDFTQDEAIEFLRSHIGYVVWGDNDGI